MAEILDTMTIFAVEDVEVSRDYYIRRMGFEEHLRVGGWSFLRRGKLQLRIGHCPGIVPISDCQDHSLIVHAEIDDANALHAELLERGADVSTPEDKPWGYREFGAGSPDGHRFLFMQALTPAPAGED